MKAYQCFCDLTRLRILNLLMEGPLCVCHLTEILDLPQPKVSRHLKALRDRKAVETERCYNWTICRIPETVSPVLEANLKCLQNLRDQEKCFQADLRRRELTIDKIISSPCDDLPTKIRTLAANCR